MVIKNLLLGTLAGSAILNFGLVGYGLGRWISGEAVTPEEVVGDALSLFAAPPRPTTFVDVLTYKEGIGAWRTSLQELLHLAEGVLSSHPAANFVLVEPCMKGGRLWSCDGNVGGGSKGVRVSDIFDLSWALEPPIDGRPPLMVSYEEYKNALRRSNSEIQTYQLCFDKSPAKCPAGYSSLRYQGYWHMEWKARGNIRRSIFARDPKDFTVLEIRGWWHGSGLNYLTWTAKLRSGKHYADIPQRQLLFHPRRIQTVQDVLERQAKIANGAYSTIHWRAEKEGMNYTQCAQAVLEVKRHVIRSQRLLPHHQFVLMTSLNKDPAKMWAGSNSLADASNGTAAHALHLLVNRSGFVKFDDLLERSGVPLEDSGMLAVYDLILAARSETFASCSRDGVVGCSERAREVCNACNHVGKFGRLAMEFRRELSKPKHSSLECWPQDD